MKTQKIKYKLPQTRYFSMEFPEVQTLSAGMNWTIPITFRPVAKESYDDVIEFSTSFGNFAIPIKATLPEHVMDFPSEIDFGFSPIRETAKINFLLSNVGELTSYYEWSIEAPFFISPSSGELAPGASCPVLIEFKPKEAMVLEGTAICAFGIKENWEKTKVVKTARVSGISKFSHLICDSNEPVFDFGKVNVGTYSEKKLTLKNPSPVHANFKIKKASKDNDECFTFSTMNGRVEAGSSVEIDIKYTPIATGLFSNAFFDVTTQSGNIVRLTLSGEGLGPIVSVEPSVLNFNDIPAGTTVTRVFYLKNDANTTASYQFNIDKSSSFQLDKQCGTIGPHSVIPIQVKICPVDPMNYYRKIYCLVENQDAIAIEFLATCYNDKRRPATFKYHHVLNYQKRVENGLWEYGPEQLEEMIKSETLRCKEGVLEFIDPQLAEKHKLSAKKDDPYERGVVASEYFFQNTGDNLACALLDTYVDFGSCSRYRAIEPQIIRIQNRTRGKMTCVWIDNEDTGGDPIFSVSPMTADIPPKGVVEFQVFFRPTVDNEFYGKVLECYCYFKSMRNFRLVNEDTFTPPWCLTPKVGGNTFPPGQDTFIPKIDWGKQRVTFSSCYVDRSEYQVLKIANAGDTTVKFSFLDLGTNSQTGNGCSGDLASRAGSAFSAKPRIGVLRKNETRLIVLRFCPSEKRLYEEGFTCFFNNSVHSTYSLHLRGHGSIPDVQFENDNSLRFKPTCIGSVSQRRFQVRNTSKVSLQYEWHIPKHFANIIGIYPTSGKLEPDGIAELCCTFAPTTANLHTLKIPCYYVHGAENEAKRRSTFIVIGEGIFGELNASPANLSFDNVLINTTMEKEITIFNPSACDVNYSLIAQRKTISADGTSHMVALKDEFPESELQILQKSSILPARSNTTVKIKVCLKNEAFYEFKILYKMDQDHENHAIEALPTAFVTSQNLYYLATITAKGVHPVMAVTDIRSESISKTILWQLFSLDRFNELLGQSSKDPNAFVEQAIDNDKVPTDEPNVNLETLSADLNYDFGATSVGSKPTLLKIALQNTGVVPVDWAFNFPNDFDIKVERWADPGELTEEQAKRNFILDNNIFYISPKSGKLAPGEMVHILMSYSHEFAGPHRLPVVFRLRNGNSKAGKEILINLIGYSVPFSQKFLHLQSINHQFSPITIGTQHPPVQYYRLMNRCSSPLHYKIDTETINQLNQENYNFEILKLLNTEGVIQPGEMEYLQFIFNPLEVKEYELDIPIIVNNGKRRMITIRGRGINASPDLDKNKFEDPRVLQESIPLTPTLPPLVHPVASISLERIDFGHVPVQTIMRQVVTVTNITSNQHISVEWKVPSVWPTEAIKIFPPSSQLVPGESQVFKIVFEPDEMPRLYNFDVHCAITNETALVKSSNLG
jgi:hypothetical protein